MPAVPSCILDPIRDQFLALLPTHEDRHPWGCHNPRISDAVVFDRETLRLLVLAAYDRMIGLELDQLSADGCITEAPSGGECAGKSPVDRAKRGLKRSQLTDGRGIPLVTDPAPANTRDHTLLPATLDRFADLEAVLGPLPEHPSLSLDAGYDYSMVHLDLKARGIFGQIAERGAKTSIQAGGRWVVECTNSWMNNFGKLRRCTERRRAPVEFFIALASTIITVRCLLRRAWTLYRWGTRPRNPRIR
ncbi:IS5/IS1182 family transposase [Streptomyces lunaelactis]|uniref:IS5/IS1182 family transposase n=1 Tax=Streptomyces lunaelactis TaxID=1535768 RepID=A0A2R4TFJ2_9ACTN|nr:transposase [Streptomyces lunaelactis]AVZ77880.1 IS5/IS1182 family transposase [Streptomyces lunaelactis]NUK86276.1 transposase [Streptomyces lunaelactis]